VGLPLAVAFAESGFPVAGIDVDAAKVDAINEGRSCVKDPFDEYRPVLALRTEEGNSHE